MNLPMKCHLSCPCTPKCTVKLNIVASARFVSKSERVHSVLDVKQSPSFHLRVKSLHMAHLEALAANLDCCIYFS